MSVPATEELVFDTLEPVRLPVKIAGRPYLLVEASESAAVVWRNFFLKAATFKAGKMSSFGGQADGEPLLVSLCLHYATPLPDGSLKVEGAVPLNTVKGWPARIVKALFEKAKEISHLGEGDKKKSAGDGGAGANGSTGADPTTTASPAPTPAISSSPMI